MQRYEVLPHTADAAVQVYGSTLADLYTVAGTALFEMMFQTTGAEAVRRVDLQAEGADAEETLVAWLSELLFVAEVEGAALVEIDVDDATENRVRGSAGVVPVDRLVLSGTPIKAVTYHDMAIRLEDGELTARIVFAV